MLTYPIKIEGLKGVGNVELDLQDDQRAYVLIGENGVGKTKTLESLFQTLLHLNKQVVQLPNTAGNTVQQESWVFTTISSNSSTLKTPATNTKPGPFNSPTHELPVIFLASQNRGFIEHESSSTKPLGTFRQRRQTYLQKLIKSMNHGFTSLNMDSGIEEWFVTIAKSANPYQKQEDNREVEIKALLSLMHKIDKQIDPEHMSIEGDDRVNIKVDEQLRELSHLSTGFASILKILQAIISGYGYFTNETNLQQVKGIVLIDEIESHLHLSWQAKIVPLLKQLFPNTTFYITTHSSIVLSQLKDGEAYRLQRDDDGVVRTKTIKSPNKASLIDVLKDAFDIDLNRLKLDNIDPNDQKKAKQQLLELVRQQG